MITSYDAIQTMDRVEDAESIPYLDLRREAENATELWEYWSCGAYNEESLGVLFFPEIGRAGIAHGGDAVWTDADSVQDAIERYFGEDDKEISD